MATQQSIPLLQEAYESFLTGSSPAPRPQRRFRRFLAFTFLPFCLAYLAMFPLIMIPQLKFDRWGGLKWIPVLDYGFKARGVNADVVIFGDSSAFLGIDPRRVDQELGTRVVIIPNTIGSLPVTGEMALREYLAHNAPPRLIIFYFTPWNLDFTHNENPRLLFEGEEMLLRHGSLREIAAFAWKHPGKLLQFPLQLNSNFGLDSLKQTLANDRGHMTAEDHGHIDYTDAYGPMTSCMLPTAMLSPTRTASIRSLEQRYASPQTRVVVYLAPVPACGNAGVFSDRSFAPLTSRPPAILPASWFATDGLYAHILPPHVAASTQLFIDSMRSTPELNVENAEAAVPVPARR